MTDAPRPPLTVSPEELKASRLLQGLDADTLATLARSVEVERAEPGQVLISEGEIAAHMFLVIDGELEVLARGAGDRDVRMALLGPSDWVGEMAVLDVQPRSATVRAVAPTRVVKLTAGDVRDLLYENDIGQYALFVMNIARELSRRLRVADGLIAAAAGNMAERYVEQSRRPPPR